MLKVIGIGNAFRSDDGIGPYIIEHIKKNDIPVPIQLFDLGTDAFSLIEHLSGEDPIMIVDSADLGRNAGEVMKIELSENTLKKIDQSISIHGFSVSELYRIARMIGPIAPCSIIGVQPKILVPGDTLSDEVMGSIPEIINLITLEARKYAEKNSRN